jgi:hypothetical protein
MKQLLGAIRLSVNLWPVSGILHGGMHDGSVMTSRRVRQQLTREYATGRFRGDKEALKREVERRVQERMLLSRGNNYTRLRHRPPYHSFRKTTGAGGFSARLLPGYYVLSYLQACIPHHNSGLPGVNVALNVIAGVTSTADFCYPHITAGSISLGCNRDTHKAHAVGLSGAGSVKHQLCTSFKDPLINPVNT